MDSTGTTEQYNKGPSIKIIDAPTGEGKTTSLITYLQNNFNSFQTLIKEQKRFIVLVPLLDECERLSKALKETGIETFTPKIKGRKNKDTLEALREGLNIITTHRFLEMTPIEFYETLKDSSERYSYSIFIDEEPTVEVAFKDSPLSNLPSLDSSDIDTMRHKNIISVDEKSNRITWTAEEPLKGIYRHYRDFFKGYVVYLSKEACQHNLDNPFIIHIRPEMWSLFESVTVLSYRVKYSIFRAYCNLYQLPLDYYHVSRDSDTFVEGYVEKKPKGCKRLCICKDYLETFRNEEVNIKGLSYSWYNKTNTKGIKALRSYMDKCIRNKPFGTILWTTYKPKKEALKIPKHGLNDKNWIACNTKATNDYKDHTTVIYGINRYMNPFKASFWQSQGIHIDMDNWSLNELIQFLWRSNLRDTHSSDTVYVYIPSDRMRGLLEEWLLND